MLGNSTKIIVVLFLAAVQFSSMEVIPSTEDICRLFADGTVLRQPGYCDRWITCQNHKTVSGGVCAKGQTFTKEKCGTAQDYYCTATPCYGTSGYMSDTRHCAGWYYCDGTVAMGSGFCDGGLYFDQSKGMCVYQTDTSCQKYYQVCDVVAPNINFLDEQNCHKYYYCNSYGGMESVECPEGNYYDVDTGECVRKSKVQCAKHPYPENVCGTTKLAYGGRFVSDGATCSGYFYCRDLGSRVPDPAPIWATCPYPYFFNAEKGGCTEREAIRCIEDRCDGIANGTTLSQTPGCRNYLVCKNSATVSEETCPNGTFFNAGTLKCSTTKISYKVCS